MEAIEQLVQRFLAWSLYEQVMGVVFTIMLGYLIVGYPRTFWKRALFWADFWERRDKEKRKKR